MTILYDDTEDKHSGIHINKFGLQLLSTELQIQGPSTLMTTVRKAREVWERFTPKVKVNTVEMQRICGNDEFCKMLDLEWTLLGD